MCNSHSCHVSTMCAKCSGIGFSSRTAATMHAWSLCILANRPLSISRSSFPRGTRGKAGAKMSSDHDVVQHFFTCQVIPRHLCDGILSVVLVHTTSPGCIVVRFSRVPIPSVNRFATTMSWLPGLCEVDIFAAIVHKTQFSRSQRQHLAKARLARRGIMCVLYTYSSILCVLSSSMNHCTFGLLPVVGIE